MRPNDLLPEYLGSEGPESAGSGLRLGHISFFISSDRRHLPTDDPLFGKGTIRADGRKIHPAYLFEVKKPAESKGPWDYYKLRTTIPADQAFRPLSEGNCPIAK